MVRAQAASRSVTYLNVAGSTVRNHVEAHDKERQFHHAQRTAPHCPDSLQGKSRHKRVDLPASRWLKSVFLRHWWRAWLDLPDVTKLSGAGHRCGWRVQKHRVFLVSCHHQTLASYPTLTNSHRHLHLQPHLSITMASLHCTCALCL